MIDSLILLTKSDVQFLNFELKRVKIQFMRAYMMPLMRVYVFKQSPNQKIDFKKFCLCTFKSLGRVIIITSLEEHKY